MQIKRILQIMPCFENVENGVPLKLPIPPNQARFGRTGPRFGDELIRGMALVESENHSTSIEWIVWNPATRRIRITDGFYGDDSCCGQQPCNY